MKLNEKTALKRGNSVFRKSDNLEMMIIDLVTLDGMSTRLLCRYDENGTTKEEWYKSFEVWSKPGGKW